MLSVWWDFKGFVYSELLLRNQTINCALFILYRSQKNKDKFVNQSDPTKIMKIKEFFVFDRNFLKEPQIPILVSDSGHKSLLIILIKFFD